MERKAKEKLVGELDERLKRAGAMFLAEYSGMSVAQISKLRRELDNVGGEFKVTKNTLLTLAARGTRAQALEDEFVGPNAVIYSYRDPVGVAKVLAATAKDIPKLKLKSGLLGEKRIKAQEVVTLATLPPKEVLVAKLLGLLAGMPQRLVGTLAANIMQLLWTLNALKAKKETI